jgi:hypothetical protein
MEFLDGALFGNNIQLGIITSLPAVIGKRTL